MFRLLTRRCGGRALLLLLLRRQQIHCYSASHEWIADTGEVGITDYAQQQLGDVVYVELPSHTSEPARPSPA